MKTKDTYNLYRESKLIGQYSFKQLTEMWSKNEIRPTDQIQAVGNKSFRDVSTIIPALERGSAIDISKNEKRGKYIALAICALVWIVGIAITHYGNMKQMTSWVSGFAVILYFFIKPSAISPSEISLDINASNNVGMSRWLYVIISIPVLLLLMSLIHIFGANSYIFANFITGLILWKPVSQRLKNIGRDESLSFLVIIPVLQLLVLIPCFLFPQGYEQHRKLDWIAKTLLVFSVISVALLVKECMSASHSSHGIFSQKNYELQNKSNMQKSSSNDVDQKGTENVQQSAITPNNSNNSNQNTQMTYHFTDEWYVAKSESWQRAINKYPDCAVNGSKFRKRMFEYDEWAKTNNPELYRNSNKPMIYADAVYEEMLNQDNR